VIDEATNSSTARTGNLRSSRNSPPFYARRRGWPMWLRRRSSQLADRIEVAFIFGSVARGAETEGSDIDVLIIGSVDFGAVIDALHSAQQWLAREINPKVFSTNEWKMKVRVPDPFISDVLSKKKIFLIGDEHGLAELGRRES
jgi:predicted nucleotidyltransferase